MSIRKQIWSAVKLYRNPTVNWKMLNLAKMLWNFLKTICWKF